MISTRKPTKYHIEELARLILDALEHGPVYREAFSARLYGSPSKGRTGIAAAAHRLAREGRILIRVSSGGPRYELNTNETT